ncbi:MAG: hypothetical protein V2J55_16085 [Candidatus Competibacteraceae bacterium]|jgi:site-specific recombinase XerC|nr:hypothetical protein [Candidatus Competibacteraceae bacterium]
MRSLLHFGSKHASAHSFHHSLANRLLQANYDIRTTQELLGHGGVRDAHTTGRNPLKEAKSPLDF